MEQEEIKDRCTALENGSMIKLTQIQMYRSFLERARELGNEKEVKDLMNLIKKVTKEIYEYEQEYKELIEKSMLDIITDESEVENE